MPSSTWSNLEEYVRSLASLMWDRPAAPEQIGGVNIDCVLKLDVDSYVLIEITEERNLNKIREDIVKLNTARGTLFHSSSIHAKCICVVGAESITAAMAEAGKSQNIYVNSLTAFTKLFFNFNNYSTARQRFQFGSAVNPVTGEKDDTSYIPVTYLAKDKEINIADIADFLLHKKTVVMTGEYGSGKSRCVRELFLDLAKRSNETLIFPIAIDLKENWGLKRAQEMIRRHMEDLGLPSLANNVLKTIASGHFIFILDGFDELGLQSWSDDNEKLKNIRHQSLSGVRDLVSKVNGGIFICGREHYFNNDDEMYSALGVKDRKPVQIHSKVEFSELELAKYMQSIAEDYEIPAWLPRRPLICQAILSLAEEELERMLGSDGGDVEFWHKFMEILCRRDAKISSSLDSDTIYGVLLNLARTTRFKMANVGPLSLTEIQKAFEQVVGQTPDDQASVMLQRLPGLGRVQAESNDRQFLDMFILDGLRAIDLNSAVAKKYDTTIELSAWRNPLGKLGLRILSRLMRDEDTEKGLFQITKRAVFQKNRVLCSDVIAAIIISEHGEYDFGGLAVDDGNFAEFDMTLTVPMNLWISNSSFGNLTLCPKVPSGTRLTDCIANNIFGVTSAKGLPAWADVVADHYQPSSNIALIRKLGLQPSQQILVTIIRKTFFQKGAGRKEEALLRGLGNIGSPGVANKIVNLLLRNNILESFKGREGAVYTPIRSNAARMEKIMAELNTSTDPIWVEVSNM